MADDVKRWRCKGCGVRVSMNCTGQVRDEKGGHHNMGEQACLRVLRRRIAALTRENRMLKARRG